MTNQIETGQDTENEAAVANDFQRYLLFSLATERFAISLKTVREAIAFPELTLVPQSPPHFLGISDLRGEVLPIVDLRNKFGLDSKIDDDTAVIVCVSNGSLFGIVVSAVETVVTLTSSCIKNFPEVHGGRPADFIEGVHHRNGELVMLIDIAKALTTDDLSTFAQLRSATSKAA